MSNVNGAISVLYFAGHHLRKTGLTLEFSKAPSLKTSNTGEKLQLPEAAPLAVDDPASGHKATGVQAAAEAVLPSAGDS